MDVCIHTSTLSSMYMCIVQHNGFCTVRINTHYNNVRVYLIPHVVLVHVLVVFSDVNKQKKRVPKGTSDYQATWIQDDDNKVSSSLPPPVLHHSLC